jgi:uncharacterized protein
MRLSANIVQFVRLLRRAGLPVGPGQALLAVEAVEAIGVEERAAMRQALFAALVTRPEQFAVFGQCFDIFWRNPNLSDRAMGMLLPAARPNAEPRTGAAASRRLSDALGMDTQAKPRERDVEIDMAMSASGREALAAKDFEQMSAAELSEAKRVVAAMDFALPERPSRRRAAASAGPLIDLRRSLREGLRTGGDMLSLASAARAMRRPPVVVLCDISGSMSRYSRLFLHFMHALSGARRRAGQRVTSFTFGTRLTNVTRTLRHRDPDEALAAAGREAGDWGGGTRIGEALKEFNWRWGRRVLAQGATVVLITDGLERDGAEALAAEAARLRRSCKDLIWLNPLLRYGGFAPKAAGIRALLPHVTRFLPLWNLDTLAQVGAALGGTEVRRHIRTRKAA